MLLVKGQKIKISDLTASKRLEVNVTLKLSGSGLIHHVCLGLDPHRLLADKRFMVIDPAPSVPGGGLRLLGPGRGEAADFLVNLDALPGSVPRVAFATVIEGPATFNQLSYGHLRLSLEGKELARFVISGNDFANEKSLILGQLYLHQGIWRLSSDAQGFTNGAEGLFGHFGAMEALESIPATSKTRLVIIIPPMDDSYDDDPEGELVFENDAWPEEDAFREDDDAPAPTKPRIIH